MHKFSIQILHQKDFPPLLKEITDPPKKLYYRGNIDLLFTQCISIVGTRKINSYGKYCISQIVPLLTQHLTIISGLAFGVDAHTHLTTLKNSGSTISVLPSGLDNSVISPQSNLYLARKILENNGLLISEYEPNTKTQKWHFAARNRIIAGLSNMTLIIQAALKSGSLITAHHARDYNRIIGSIPGPIDSKIHQGSNSLISQGAYMITTPEEILSLYDITHQSQKLIQYKPDNLAEEAVLKYITQYPQTIDKIYESCKLETKLINSTISVLELKGIVKHEYTGIYRVK